MDKNTEQIENYKKVFDNCLDQNQTIKKLILKGWFAEGLIIGIIIWQFFVIYKLHQILIIIQKIQLETAMNTGQLLIIP
jgi:hypothetical protein